MVGDSTDAVIQGVIVFALGIILGLGIDPLTFFAALPVMLLITFGLVSIGLTIASFMGSLESFGAIQSFINLPLFFLSGALFPIPNLPDWLQFAAKLNPMSYGVDALKQIILGSPWQPLQLQPFFVDLAVVGVFDLAMIGIGTWAFTRMK
jgi:ABC-2 type transport system permease protein